MDRSPQNLHTLRVKERAGLMSQGFVVRGVAASPTTTQINPTDCFPTCATNDFPIPQQSIIFLNPGQNSRYNIIKLKQIMQHANTQQL